MYQLTLTESERKEFDWVGNRYHTGDDTADAIRQGMPESSEWDDSGDITFQIPEHVAWGIKECSEDENDLWPCFGPDLARKMRRFVDQIV